MEGGIVACSLEGGDGSEIDFHFASFCLLDHRHVALYELAGHGLAASTLGCSDIVDALEDNDFLDSELSENVTIETIFGKRAESSRYYHSIIADAEVEYALVGYLVFQLQHFRHDIWPSILCVVGGAFAIGYGIAHDGDGTQVGAQRIDIYAADVVPMVFTEGLLEIGVSVCDTFHDIRGGATAHVYGWNGWSGCVVDGDGKSLQGLEIVG